MSLGRYIPALISGTALVFCFPTFDYYPLAWVALVPLLASAWDMKPLQALRAGILMGVPYFFGTLYWIYHSIYHYGGVPYLLSLGIVLMFALFLSLFTGLFCMLYSLKMTESSLPASLLAPVYWTMMEFARSYAFTGFPWSSLGYTQYKFLHAIQMADVTGVYGVSFLVVMVNGALADFVIAQKRREYMPLFNLYPTLLGHIAVILCVAAALGYGQYRLKQDRPGDTVRVAVVQGNIGQDIKWDPMSRQQVLDTYESLSREAVSKYSPALVVWPETAVPFYFGADKERTQRLKDFQRGLGAYLLFGAVTVKDEEGLANSAVLLGGDGAVKGSYDKIHLVPFGEYVPLKRALFFVDRLAEGIGDYVPGSRAARIKSPFGEFGVLVCYEMIFPGLARKFYADGGDLLVGITNDAWFGGTAGPYQHFSMAALRAVENRKAVVRAANTGVSGFIDSTGRILGTTALFKRTVISEDMRKDRTRSFYSRFGDLFSYACLIIGVAVFIYSKEER